MIGIKKTYFTDDDGNIVKINTNQLESTHFSKAQKILQINQKKIENEYKKILRRYCRI
tara:strand:+ start:391 stop:564 length:174 start_codon:yes stop_codon:yes gene_type:complete